MTKAKTQAALQKMAESLRKKAELLRKKKEQSSLTIVGQLANAGVGYGTTMQKYGEIITATATGLVTVCEEIVENPQVQKQVVTLVANLIDNTAARVNEVANIVESVSKSQKLQEAIVNAKKAAEEFAKAAEHFTATASKAKLRKFKVVPEETPASRKSSKKNADKRSDA